ncbi:DUF3597 domain-containing protein [Paraburkholderia phosphatilytica]|uniref:DUF3597 domain-containing protein n=1 Tax=Paraburkholderia phosphatilytica TaxID=2282883 RepID=UPI000E48F5F3|nr:DUF3597 domain-containing protein [Paraburkholderia phosphatilytica]
MSIFGTIVSKLFGHAKPDETPPAPEAVPTPAATADAATADATAAAAPAAAAVLSDVDVAAVLDQLAASNSQKLDWRHSIVDTMKLLDVDSSLEHRKQLAAELKYDGDTNDSASMNIWLHKQLMQALAANGGKLPADLLG